MPHDAQTLPTITRSRVRVMQYQNLLEAAGIASELAKDDVRSGQMTAQQYQALQKKLRALQEGLDAVWALQSGTKPVREAMDSPALPGLLRLQAC